MVPEDSPGGGGGGSMMSEASLAEILTALVNFELFSSSFLTLEVLEVEEDNVDQL